MALVSGLIVNVGSRGRSLGPLHRVATTAVPKGINAVVFDRERRQVACRTDDPYAPLQLYDYKGTLLREFSAPAQLADGEFRGLGVDSRRGLLLAPVDDNLLRVRVDGETYDSLPVPGDLKGVAYLPEEDAYVITDQSECEVRKIDAVTGKVTLTFSADMTSPWEVAVRQVAGVNGDAATIIISDHDEGCVRLFTSGGVPLRTLQTGSGRRPWGVSVDPAGRVLVSDCEGEQVLAFGGAVQEPEVIVPVGQCPTNKAWFLDCDAGERMIVVSDYQSFSLLRG